MVHLGREKGKAEGKGGMRNGTKKYEHTEGGQKESNRNSITMREWKGRMGRQDEERDEKV